MLLEVRMVVILDWGSYEKEHEEFHGGWWWLCSLS